MAVEEVDSGEKRLIELRYKQELRREMTLFKMFAISFSTTTLYTGISPLYSSSIVYAGLAALVWGFVVVSFYKKISEEGRTFEHPNLLLVEA